MLCDDAELSYLSVYRRTRLLDDEIRGEGSCGNTCERVRIGE